MIDTHCHIHDDQYGLAPLDVIATARSSGVTGMICVGTDALSSQQAIDLASAHNDIYATVGLHPHDAAAKKDDLKTIAKLAANDSVVAIGECGLDYYYLNADKASQAAALRAQLVLASEHSLPVSFHVRGSKENPQDAFDDLWQILSDYTVSGVMHSFTGDRTQLSQILDRGLSVALNGIVTFSNDQEHTAMVAAVPLDKLLLETDAPFLTPKPFRGTINEPKNVRYVAEYVASIRTEDSLSTIINHTTRNAELLFGL